MLFRIQQLLALTLFCSVSVWGQAQPDMSSAIAEALKLASAGNLQRAEEILTQLEKASPEHPEVQYRLGLVLLRQQKTAAAGERLEKAARLAPSSPLTWLGVAQTRLQLGRRDEAIEAGDRALALAPDEPGVARALAMFYVQAKDFAKAADQQLRWARTQPQDAQALGQAAELYLEAGNPDRAIELAGQLSEKGDSAAVHSLLGRSYRLKNDPARAVKELQQAIRLDASNPANYLDLAQLFIDHRTPQPAVVILEEGIRQLPNEPELVRLLGLAHYGTGDSEKALDTFLKLTDMQPDSQVAYASLETLLPSAGGRLPEILERLRGYSERNPADPVGYFLQARALQTQSEDAAAQVRALLEKAIAAAPEFWPAHFELHKLLLEAGDAEGAARALEKTVELNPEYAPAHYSLAQVYARLGNREAARKSRETHHTLATEQREAAEQRREEAPSLPYTIVER
jgi:tetratricopeptide (TPR) repeat protein